ncbi:hypothetical protein ACJJTC_015542 [Scirpophaga incertulas]
MVLFLWLFAASVLCVCQCQELDFPPGFQFGVGSSSYQVEGGWNVSDKAESIWDRYILENPDGIRNRSTGKMACNSYRLWQRDIDMVAEMGLDFYRFSISWPRILPTGFSNRISEDGKNYYNNLINGLLEKGIQPVVTIYHWDLPQRLQNLGGWTNPLIADWFVDYARVLFTLYGDRVKTWHTINEPWIICDFGYVFLPPAISDYAVGRLLCNKHVLLAHAKAWRLYDTEFRPKYNGQIAIVNQLTWIEPAGQGDEDIAELAFQDTIGRYTYPIFSKEGGWPQRIQKIIAKKSKEEGYDFSRLPDFTQEEVELIRGTYDFFGMNHYTSRIVRKRRNDETIHTYILQGSRELEIVFETRPEWKNTSSVWFKEFPQGFRRILQWVKRSFGDIKIYVTENGYASDSSSLEDYNRISYLRSYLEQMLLAIKEDGINVLGYTVWTLMDNFEWIDGYHSKFGLYYVNFECPNRTRTPRLSAKYYASVAKSHSLNIPDQDKYIVDKSCCIFSIYTFIPRLFGNGLTTALNEAIILMHL